MKDAAPIHFVGVGDIMLGRGVKLASEHEALELLSPELLKCLEADIVTGNLECLIGSSGRPNPASHSHFQCDPAFAQSLLQMFDVLSLANNHIGDFGDEGVNETLDWLAKYGIRAVGIGQNAEEALEPATFDIRGCKVAVFGATTVGTLSTSSRYTLAEPGEDLYRCAKRFRDTGYTCVLHLHAGGGDVCYPSPATRMLLDTAANKGFNIVLGHHPHVIQGFEVKFSRAVFYSLGDFIFDKIKEGRDRSLLAKIKISSNRNLVGADVCVVQRSPDLRLELLKGDELSFQMKSLQSLSDMIRTGLSDEAYRKWRGNRVARLVNSILRDYQAGGFQAIKMKLQRTNGRKLLDLFFGR